MHRDMKIQTTYHPFFFFGTNLPHILLTI